MVLGNFFKKKKKKELSYLGIPRHRFKCHLKNAFLEASAIQAVFTFETRAIEVNHVYMYMSCICSMFIGNTAGEKEDTLAQAKRIKKIAWWRKEDKIYNKVSLKY